jgi:hypothetical protein
VTEPLPAEIESIILAELAKRVKERDGATRALFSQRYGDGDKATFRSPLDDTRLGTVYRSDPDAAWVVTNTPAVMDYLHDQSDAWETIAEIRLPNGDLVGMDTVDELAVLVREHAPHLYSESRQVKPHAIDELLDQSRRDGKPACAGIERRKPAGRLSVRPAPTAGDAISRMVEAGIVTWDGRVALPEAGESA